MIFENLIYAAIKKSNVVDFEMWKNLLGDESKGLYVIGKNEQAAEIIKRYRVSGVIDDYTNLPDRWNGLPVLRSGDVNLNSIVVNCVTSICPVQVKRNLEVAGFKTIVPVSDLISDGGELLSLPWFVAQQREEISERISFWNSLYENLADEVSKVTLLDVLRFRLTADPVYMRDYSVRLNDQYFEDFMNYQHETFVDAGGFDGDTSEEFIKRYPDYKKIVFFEPSKKNMIAAKRRLKGMRNIDFRCVGVSDAEATLHFNADAGSASAVTQGVGDTISVVPMDQELANEDSVTFIKMDLEGWEMNALRGAEGIIRKNRPKLAIAVYHSAKDFREVPEFLLSINPDYKIFLRHYTQGWSETVMYFV